MAVVYNRPDRLDVMLVADEGDMPRVLSENFIAGWSTMERVLIGPALCHVLKEWPEKAVTWQKGSHAI